VDKNKLADIETEVKEEDVEVEEEKTLDRLPHRSQLFSDWDLGGLRLVLHVKGGDSGDFRIKGTDAGQFNPAIEINTDNSNETIMKNSCDKETMRVRPVGPITITNIALEL